MDASEFFKLLDINPESLGINKKDLKQMKMNKEKFEIEEIEELKRIINLDLEGVEEFNKENPDRQIEMIKIPIYEKELGKIHKLELSTKMEKNDIKFYKNSCADGCEKHLVYKLHSNKVEDFKNLILVKNHDRIEITMPEMEEDSLAKELIEKIKKNGNYKFNNNSIITTGKLNVDEIINGLNLIHSIDFYLKNSIYIKIRLLFQDILDIDKEKIKNIEFDTEETCAILLGVSVCTISKESIEYIDEK